MEADADVAVVIEGDEVEGTRTGKEHIPEFAEREGRFEEDRPHDEEAVEEKQGVGEGELGFGLGEGFHENLRTSDLELLNMYSCKDANKDKENSCDPYP